MGHINKAKLIYSAIIIIISLGGTVFKGYTTIEDSYNNILSSIENNTKAVETTQITMLKSIVREFEKKGTCNISDAEWDEYILNYSTLFDLKMKYKLISIKAQWLPIERKIDCLSNNGGLL